MKEMTVNFEQLPIIIKYGNKEYVLKATPKGLLLIKKEYQIATAQVAPRNDVQVQQVSNMQ